MTAVQSFYKLYRALEKNAEENLMDIFESLESVKLAVNKWASSTYPEMSAYISDDTTSGRTLDLQEQSGRLSELLDSLLEDYLGISEEEAEILLNSVRKICEDLAVIHFSTNRYGEYFESIQNNTFSLEDIEMTPYVAEVAAQGAGMLTEDIRTVMEVLIVFKVYLPEYTLSDEDLQTLMDYMEESRIASYKIGSMSRRAVKEGLDDV